MLGFGPASGHGNAWETRDLTFDYWELDLASAPGMLGKQREFTFELWEFDFASAPGTLGKQRAFTFESLEGRRPFFQSATAFFMEIDNPALVRIHWLCAWRAKWEGECVNKT